MTPASPLQIEVQRAPRDGIEVIANLHELYIHDFTDYVHLDLHEDGRYRYEGLEDYWKEDGLHPFLARANGRLCGFALVQRGSVISSGPDVWDMEEFFVLRRYRRRGVGTTIADRIWDEFPGSWEIRVLVGNDPALRFWSGAVEQRIGRPVKLNRVEVEGQEFDVFRFHTSV